MNICDNVSKLKAMNRVIKIIKKTEDEVKTIGVGDNYNDLDMLRNSNIACLVFNDQFLMEPVNINNCLVSKMVCSTWMGRSCQNGARKKLNKRIKIYYE